MLEHDHALRSAFRTDARHGQCHATPRHATPRHATPRHATPTRSCSNLDVVASARRQTTTSMF
ncbi:hypothetical protein F8280_06865 [Micromonospora noduli]|nr:hypothetical protein F8280_06865 [Micromonospora noduli]